MCACARVCACVRASSCVRVCARGACRVRVCTYTNPCARGARMRFSQTRRTDGPTALVDGSGGVCDYRGIRSPYIRIYRGGGGGGSGGDLRGRRRRRRRSHGPQCAFSDGPGRAQETDRKHALPVHNGPMAAIQEHTGVSNSTIQNNTILYHNITTLFSTNTIRMKFRAGRSDV